jgi:hypothetical protein
MKRLPILLSLAVLLTSANAQSREVAAKDEGLKPNILFSVADDLGWRDTAVYDSTFYETPHIDALAASGMMFTDAYAANPLCSPTRASRYSSTATSLPHACLTRARQNSGTSAY